MRNLHWKKTTSVGQFGRDFLGGMKMGSDAFKTVARYVQGAGHKLDRVANTKIPLVNDLRKLLIDDSLFEEVIDQVNIASKVTGDLASIAGDVSDIAQTGRFMVKSSRKYPYTASTLNPYHAQYVPGNTQPGRPADEGIVAPMKPSPYHPSQPPAHNSGSDWSSII